MNYDELVKELRYEASYAYLGSDEERLSKMMRDAADAIEELQKRLCESIPKGDAEIIISEVAKPRWISVKERLPEPYSWVLGFGFGETELPIEVFYDGSEWKDSVLGGWYITHWMPLPEPPEDA